ncbi:M23 family metallopeptidase [Pontibacter ruber]|uniref:Peptidoglycan DD-metalloendopeptidase family protein n=1 Tax=Pontibacter ruber TaxID=1343895 RepID=A0ABW5CY14_9BACT|nr:M23 family metallopeptidase [Pontibacter ruber]
MRRNSSRILPFILYTLLVLLVAGCGGKQTLRGVLKPQSPYERYASSLKDTNLDHTALGKDWLAAGEKALHDSISVTLPFKETGYFAADRPRALSYRIPANRGEQIIVHLELKAKETFQVFMDLFEVPSGDNPKPRHLATADTTSATLTYEVEEDQQHLLRVQPELLRSGQYTITIQKQPTLAFPIPGKTSRNIASIWGDPRDAGARRHEGIDVFAPRGTPVIASTAGVIRSVSTNPRGGKVVWLTDLSRGQSLYYAHLDRQSVTPGQRVVAGDTLGFVGNTGNASSTAPHLHFGIYRYGQGATNPYPYVHQPTEPVPPVKVDATRLGTWVRVATRQANTRLQPSVKSSTYKSLRQHTPLQITGAVASWYRVRLPDNTEAYIASNVVESINKPIRYKKLQQDQPLLDDAHPKAAPMEQLSAGSSVPVVAMFHTFGLVRQQDGRLGWISIAE